MLPDNVCEMLDKIRDRSKSSVVGSSGRRSILEKHDQVIGVSSHDMVYNATVVDVSTPEQSPFAGTPSGKKSRGQAKQSHHSRHIDFGNEVINLTRNRVHPPTHMSCKSNAMTIQDIRNNAKALGRSKFNTDRLIPGACSLNPSFANGASQGKENMVKENITQFNNSLEKIEELKKGGKIVESQSKENNIKRTITQFNDSLEKVDKLTKEGKIVESLGLLLEILNMETIPREKKLLVHRKISSRAILSLGWT